MFPYLIHHGSVGLPTYGVLAAIGLIGGLWMCVRFAVRDGLNENKAWNLGIIAILGALVGAKLMFIVVNWSYFFDHPRELLNPELLQAAGVYYGGFLLGSVAALLYIWRAGLPLLRTFDDFAPGIALGHSVGRLGCFFAGCCYGRETDAAWAVTFTNPYAALISGTPLNVPLHPTQIYESLAVFCIFLVLVAIWKRRSFSGQVIGTYLFLYGIARYFIEFYRGDPGRGSVFGGAMTLTQLISILLVVAGGFLWMKQPAYSRARPVSASR